MFKDLIGKQVSVLVATKGDTILEYTGTLVSEESTHIVLENAEIYQMALAAAKSMFGAGMTVIKSNISSININKHFIISCNE